MEISYGIICRRKRQKKAAFNLPPFLWRAPPPVWLLLHNPLSVLYFETRPRLLSCRVDGVTRFEAQPGEAGSTAPFST